MLGERESGRVDPSAIGKSLSLGTSFISVLFLGFLCGYYVGKVALKLDETQVRKIHLLTTGA